MEGHGALAQSMDIFDSFFFVGQIYSYGSIRK